MAPVGRFRFENFEIDLRTGELFKSGVPLKLAPQPLRVLGLLVRRAGQLITRDEIRAELWGLGTFVEFDQGLNYCIRQIRIVLDEHARQPQFIETVPKKGYRFLATVTAVGDCIPQPASVPPLKEVRPSRRWLIGSGLAATATGAGWLLRRARSPGLPRDAQARQAFLEAEHFAASWELDRIERAVILYKDVVAAEPDFAPAWAALANAEVLLVQGARTATLADAELDARRALTLDEHLPLAHAALGHTQWHQWNWHEAEKRFKRALQLDDRAAVAHQLYGLYLASSGRRADAISHARVGASGALSSGMIQYSLAQVLFHCGEFTQAIAQCHRTLDVHPRFPLVYSTLIRSHAMSGDLDGAQKIIEIYGADVATNTDLWPAYLLARRGLQNEARSALENYAKRRSGGPPLSQAIVRLFLGDSGGALDSLTESIQWHVRSVIWMKVSPELPVLARRTALQIAALTLALSCVAVLA